MPVAKHDLTRIPAPESNTSTIGLVGNPLYEAPNIGVHCQRLYRVELPLQHLVGDGGVDVAVTWAAQQRDAVFDVHAVEVALVAPVFVPRLRDQVVPRQVADPGPDRTVQDRLAVLRDPDQVKLDIETRVGGAAVMLHPPFILKSSPRRRGFLDPKMRQ